MYGLPHAGRRVLVKSSQAVEQLAGGRKMFTGATVFQQLLDYYSTDSRGLQSDLAWPPVPQFSNVPSSWLGIRGGEQPRKWGKSRRLSGRSFPHWWRSA